MRSRLIGVVGVSVALCAASAACGSSQEGGGDEGASNRGGSPGSGGAVGDGGAVDGGSNSGTGGTSQGGVGSGVGGAPPSGGAGGSGGAGSGGAPGTGGAPTSGGGPGTGGSAPSGGAAGSSGAGSGGVPGTGGSSPSGGAPGTGGAAPSGGAAGSSGAGSGGTPSTGGTVGSGGSGNSGGEAGCVSCTFMGDDTVRIGASMADETASAAPFDARYLYLAGVVPAVGDCAACSDPCGDWWGCWQDWSQPPGQYVTSFIANAESALWQGSPRPQIPFITYYIELQASGLAEGEAQVAALDDAAFLTRYLADWRLLLERVGSHPAMLHIEPDLWGYIRFVNPDPHLVPAQVTAANPTDCAGQEDSAAGLARCMIQMVRIYAPAATVGLHASPWLIDVEGDGLDTGTFMAALGAGDGDFVVADTADRDAGYYDTQDRDTWWHDDADAQQFLDWVRDVSESICQPAVVWQIPVGNMSLDNTTDHWQDTRVDWLFAHMPAAAEAHIAALLFGAGAGGMTTPETDGGNLIAQTTAYREAGGTRICP